MIKSYGSYCVIYMYNCTLHTYFKWNLKKIRDKLCNMHCSGLSNRDLILFSFAFFREQSKEIADKSLWPKPIFLFDIWFHAFRDGFLHAFKLPIREIFQTIIEPRNRVHFKKISFYTTLYDFWGQRNDWNTKCVFVCVFQNAFLPGIGLQYCTFHSRQFNIAFLKIS